MSAALFKKAKQKALYLAILGMFSNNVPGLVLDANDWGPTGTGGTGVVFQDLSGTAVTAMEQPVQLILDKSQGLKLGSELITPAANQTFSSDTGFWSKGDASVTISGGAFNFSSTPNTQALYHSSTGLIPGFTATRVTYTILSVGAGGVRVGANGQYGATRTTPGTYTDTIFNLNGGAFFGFYAVGVTTASVTNVSFRQIAGNHAYVSASANRPVISARYNQFTKSEFQSGLTGESYAGLVTLSSISGYVNALAFGYDGSTISYILKSVALISGSTNVISCVVKMDDGNAPSFGSASVAAATNDFALSISNSPIAPNTYTVIPLGGGLFRVSATATAAANSAHGLLKYGGNSSRTFKVTALDLRPSDQATGLIPTYQRVNTATDYDTVGFPPMIRGNGSNQYLTGNLDLSSTNKVTVWAGVRKIDTTSSRCFVHLSDTVLTNNGAFYIDGPDSGNDYGFDAKGTIENYQATSPYVPPITNTLCMAADIGATSLKGYVNGVLKVNSSASMGTGNFGSYPYYVLSRAGTGRFQSGGFNSLIILGAAATAAQISTTEAYCNQKLRAY